MKKIDIRRKKLPIVPIKTWGATKLFAWEECPLNAQLRYGRKLCPLCFKGTVGFDAPCDKCGKKKPKAAPLARGIALDLAIDAHLKAPGAAPWAGLEEVRHPKVRSTITQLQATLGTERGEVLTKHSISLDQNWKPLPKFTKGPWFWGELDVLTLFKKLAKVIDWKSGGIDKRSGRVRPNEKYGDQLEIYGTAVLCAYPQVEQVEPKLVFLDAKPPHDPVVKVPTMFRKALDSLKRKWEARIKPMFADTVFPPRPGYYCGWCDYSKAKGGPCEY